MWHDNETDKDLLGFKVHANLITEIVTDTSMLPISIGLFGDWGSGKSSVMKMLDKSLSKNPNILSISFNGWLFEGYDDAKAVLIESILNEILKSKRVEEKGKAAVKNLLKKVDWLRLGKFAVTNVGVPLLKAYTTGGISLIGDGLSKITDLIGDSFSNPEELAEKLSSEKGKSITSELKSLIKSSNKSENKTPQVVREFRDEFEKTIDLCKIDSLVIMVDDLDRCTPDRIIDNLEAIKLFLNVKKTAFIIGADRRIVRHAIQHRYKSKDLRETELDNYDTLVTDYLEKLIQIPYILPKLSETEVETYLSLLFCQKNEPDHFENVVSAFSEFREMDKYSTFGYQKIKEVIGNVENLKELAIIPTLAPLISEGLKGNPRQIKRFLNAFVLRQKLANVANFNEFRNDILIKLMILEYMNEDRFQELYTLQSKEKGTPKLLEQLEADFDETVDNEKNWNKPNIEKWIKMEPLLSDVDLSDYFWLSRDRLSISIQSANMVPTVVKNFYQSLIENPSESNVKHQIRNIENTLETQDYIDSLIKLICNGIVKDPKNITNHKLICNFIEIKNTYTLEYANALSKIPDLDLIKPAIGTRLFRIERTGSEISYIVNILQKFPKSKVYKAYSNKKDN